MTATREEWQNRAVKHFLGLNSANRKDLTQFQNWYTREILCYLTFLNETPSWLKYIFQPINQGNYSFINQISQLRILSNQLHRPACFISTEPESFNTSHFIFGMLFTDLLVIINPTGRPIRRASNEILTGIQQHLTIRQILFSNTPLQRDPDESGFVSCGALCAELMRHFSQLNPRELESELTELVAEADEQLYADLRLFWPTHLAALLTSEHYQADITAMRFQHLETLYLPNLPQGQQNNYLDKILNSPVLTLMNKLLSGDITVNQLNEHQEYWQLSPAMEESDEVAAMIAEGDEQMLNAQQNRQDMLVNMQLDDHYFQSHGDNTRNNSIQGNQHEDEAMNESLPASQFNHDTVDAQGQVANMEVEGIDTEHVEMLRRAYNEKLPKGVDSSISRESLEKYPEDEKFVSICCGQTQVIREIYKWLCVNERNGCPCCKNVTLLRQQFGWMGYTNIYEFNNNEFARSKKYFAYGCLYHLVSDPNPLDRLATYKQILLGMKQVLDLQCARGWGLIHLAASRGPREFLLLLISLGANVDLLTSGGKTALHVAVESATIVDDRQDAIKVLLEYGTKIRGDSSRRTPQQLIEDKTYYYQVICGQPSEELRREVTLGKKELFIKRVEDQTDVYYFCFLHNNQVDFRRIESEEGLSFCVLLKQERYFSEDKTVVILNDDKRPTADAISASYGSSIQNRHKTLKENLLDVFQKYQLRRRGPPEIDMPFWPYGNTRLHFACQDLDDWLVYYLLSQQADPNFRDHEGRTPSMYLAQGSSNSIYGRSISFRHLSTIFSLETISYSISVLLAHGFLSPYCSEELDLSGYAEIMSFIHSAPRGLYGQSDWQEITQELWKDFFKKLCHRRCDRGGYPIVHVSETFSSISKSFIEDYGIAKEFIHALRLTKLEDIVCLLHHYGAKFKIADVGGSNTLHHSLLYHDTKMFKIMLTYGLNPRSYDLYNFAWDNNHRLQLYVLLSALDDYFKFRLARTCEDKICYGEHETECIALVTTNTLNEFLHHLLTGEFGENIINGDMLNLTNEQLREFTGKTGFVIYVWRHHPTNTNKLIVHETIPSNNKTCGILQLSESEEGIYRILDTHGSILQIAVEMTDRTDLLKALILCEGQYADVDERYTICKHDVDMVDFKGDTALHKAIALKKRGYVNVLLAAGASVLIKNKVGQFAYDTARETRDYELIGLIRERTIEQFSNLDQQVKENMKAYFESLSFIDCRQETIGNYTRTAIFEFRQLPHRMDVDSDNDSGSEHTETEDEENWHNNMGNC